MLLLHGEQAACEEDKKLINSIPGGDAGRVGEYPNVFSFPRLNKCFHFVRFLHLLLSSYVLNDMS